MFISYNTSHFAILFPICNNGGDGASSGKPYTHKCSSTGSIAASCCRTSHGFEKFMWLYTKSGCEWSAGTYVLVFRYTLSVGLAQSPKSSTFWKASSFSTKDWIIFQVSSVCGSTFSPFCTAHARSAWQYCTLTQYDLPVYLKCWCSYIQFIALLVSIASVVLSLADLLLGVRLLACMDAFLWFVCKMLNDRLHVRLDEAKLISARLQLNPLNTHSSRDTKLICDALEC